MAVIRVEKNKNYTVMSNYHLNDRRLSLKAIGLLSRILSLPPDWDYTVEGLAAICLEGKSAVRGAIEELESAGYIERRQLHKDDGTFGGNEYVVHEQPISVSPLCDYPSTDNPSSDKPSSENRTQLNTNIQNTKELNTKPPIVPQQGDKPAKKKTRTSYRETAEWEPERFEGFWELYPRKVARQQAIKAWDCLRLPAEEINKLARALTKQIKAPEWADAKFIPHPATYLNQYRWKDQVDRTIPQQPERSVVDDGGVPEW